MTDYEYLLMARDAATQSNCKRRSIGVIFRVGNVPFPGANKSVVKCSTCMREVNECSAIHAEVDAILGAREWTSFAGTQLYIWAECPCPACLSFIARTTLGNCNIIHCLSQQSYEKVYPPICQRHDAIDKRYQLATQLGIMVIPYDIEDILAMKGELR